MPTANKSAVVTNNVLKWFTILLSVYIALPILLEYFLDRTFCIYTNRLHHHAAQTDLLLFGIIYPLITIVVIIIVFRYVSRGVRYLKDEIADGNLVINGFIKIGQRLHIKLFGLVVAFMLVVIWPYLRK